MKQKIAELIKDHKREMAHNIVCDKCSRQVDVVETWSKHYYDQVEWIKYQYLELCPECKREIMEEERNYIDRLKLDTGFKPHNLFYLWFKDAYSTDSHASFYKDTKWLLILDRCSFVAHSPYCHLYMSLFEHYNPIIYKKEVSGWNALIDELLRLEKENIIK